MIKIGIFLNCDSSWGGQYQYCLSVCNALGEIRKTHAAEIIAIYLSSNWEVVLEEYDFSRIHLIERGADIPKRIYRLGCTVIICPAWGMMLQEIVPNIPYISTIHDLMYHYDKEKFNISEDDIEFRRRLNYKMCCLSEGIFVDSNLGKKQVVELFGISCEKNIYIQPFTVPPSLMLSENDETVALKRELPKKYLFYPAALRKEKNHVRLIEAVKRIRDKGTDVTVVLTGNPDDAFEDVVKLIGKYELSNHILYINYVSDLELVYLYRNSRGMIFPTLVGPTNIPPIEAMRFGCAMAVSDVGETEEQIGDAGIIFDPEATDQIEEAIERLWNDDSLIEELQIKGKKRYEERFSAHVFNKRFQENVFTVIDQILERTVLLRELCDNIANRNVICYGAGQNGALLKSYFETMGMCIDLFIDEYYGHSEYMGISVIRLKEFQNLSKEFRSNAYIVICVPEKSRDEVEKKLVSSGCANYTYIHRDMIWELMRSIKQYPYFV